MIFMKKVFPEKYSNMIFGWHLINLTKCGTLLEYSIWPVFGQKFIMIFVQYLNMIFDQNVIMIFCQYLNIIFYQYFDIIFFQYFDMIFCQYLFAYYILLAPKKGGTLANAAHYVNIIFA